MAYFTGTCDNKGLLLLLLLYTLSFSLSSSPGWCDNRGYYWRSVGSADPRCGNLLSDAFPGRQTSVQLEHEVSLGASAPSSQTRPSARPWHTYSYSHTHAYHDTTQIHTSHTLTQKHTRHEQGINRTPNRTGEYSVTYSCIARLNTQLFYQELHIFEQPTSACPL